MEVISFLIGIVIAITLAITLICNFSLKADIQKLDDNITKLKWDIGSLESEIKHQIKKGLDDNPFTPPFNIE